jgi:hypothetical protein
MSGVELSGMREVSNHTVYPRQLLQRPMPSLMAHTAGVGKRDKENPDPVWTGDAAIEHPDSRPTYPKRRDVRSTCSVPIRVGGPGELALSGITDMEAANRSPAQTYRAALNAGSCSRSWRRQRLRRMDWRSRFRPIGPRLPLRQDQGRCAAQDRGHAGHLPRPSL